jgi:chitosanase
MSRPRGIILAAGLATVLAAAVTAIFFRPFQPGEPAARRAVARQAAPATAAPRPPRTILARPPARRPAAAPPTSGHLTARQINVMDNITAAFEHGRGVPQFASIENLHDGCGYTAGWIGFCTATGDMFDLLKRYNAVRPGNALAKYTDRLRGLAAAGTDRVDVLGGGFTADWRRAAGDPVFRRTQLDIGHYLYLAPAVAAASRAGIKSTLGLEHLFDTALQNGPGAHDCAGMPQTVRRTNAVMGGSPATGVSERRWLIAYNEIRMRQLQKPCEPGREADWPDSIDRVEALNALLRAGNWNLDPPFRLGSDVQVAITLPAG